LHFYSIQRWPQILWLFSIYLPNKYAHNLAKANHDHMLFCPHTFSFWCAEDWVQGLALARQALLSPKPHPQSYSVLILTWFLIEQYFANTFNFNKYVIKVLGGCLGISLCGWTEIYLISWHCWQHTVAKQC
jgi:hypothetical protein